MRYGLNRQDIERILHEKLDSNPDWKYYIDDEYILKIIDILVEGIADVVEENNRKLVDDLFRGRKKV